MPGESIARFLKDIQPDMLELNDRLLVTSPRTAARRGAIAAARRGQEQVSPQPTTFLELLKRLQALFAADPALMLRKSNHAALCADVYAAKRTRSKLAKAHSAAEAV